MEKKQYLTTPILDKHGMIWGFFYKEIRIFITILATIGLVTVMVGGFVYLPPKLVIKTLAYFFFITWMVRSIFIKKIDNPMYLQNWIAYTFFTPRRIEAHEFPLKKWKAVFIKKHNK